MSDDLKQTIAKMHYMKKYGLKENLLSPFLFASSLFYAIAVYSRLLGYKFGILKSQKINKFTISIGNITTGGTGKTPITAFIANYFTEKSKKCAVISRGYGGKLSLKNTNKISDGEKVYFTADLAGDEPYWIATNTKNTAVYTGKSRLNSANKAIEEVNPDVIILDDGFQHLKLKRDLNIMLIDANLGLGNSKILPLGPLREPLSEIKRADVIIFVKKDKFDKSNEFKIIKLRKKIKKRLKIPCFDAVFEAGEIYNIAKESEFLKENDIFTFTGIARPNSFFRYLEEKKLNILKKITFNDHHQYTKSDFDNIQNEAKKAGAKAIVTTEKDAVKLKQFLKNNSDELQIFALKLKVDLDFEKILGEKYENFSN